MVNRRVRLLGLLLPVLVIPLGLPALLALGFVAIFMAHELASVSVPYSPFAVAVPPSALCGVVDVFLLWWLVDVVVRFLWVRVLAVVAPVALWRSGGLSLAAGWMAAASALVLWADLVRSFGRAVGYGSGRLFAQAWSDSAWLLQVVGVACDVACDVLFGWCARWLLFLAGSMLFFSGVARLPLSGLQLWAYVRWNVRAAAVGFIILCLLPASEAVGDSRELLSDLVKVAPGCWFLWLLLPEGSDSWILYGIGSLCLAVRVWQWLTTQQERQWTFTRPTTVVAVAALEEQAVMAAAEQVTTAIDELTAAPAQVQVRVAAVDSAVAAAEVQAAADQECGDCMRALFGSQDLAVVAIGEQAAATAVTPQRTDVEVQLQLNSPAAQGSRWHFQESRWHLQEMQAAEEWHKAAVGAVMAVDEQAAVEQAVSVVGGGRHRRRHRLRRRANGAPRSCVLESGRWINLPRARRGAAGAIAAVQVCKQQRKQQRRCRFHDGSSGCRRSQCKYAPKGHAPAEDSADVLDPLVAAKLESLVSLMQAGLGRQQQEQLHQLQLQFQSVQPQQAALAAGVAAEMQTAVAAEMWAAVAAEMQAAVAAEVQAAVAAEMQAAVAGLEMQAALAAEMQAALAGLEMQATVAAEVQNEQEQQMGRLQQQQQGLDHSQQQLLSRHAGVIAAQQFLAQQHHQGQEQAKASNDRLCTLQLEQQQRLHASKLRLECVANKVETSKENLLREAFRINRICAAVGVPVGT